MRLMILAVVTAVLFSTTALAHDGGNLTHKGKYLRAKVIQVHGKRAPGRDIVRQGLRNGDQPSKRQKARYVRQLRALLVPARPYPAQYAIDAVRPGMPPAGTLQAQWSTGSNDSSNAYVSPWGCEARHAQQWSSNGSYWGKYQFDRQTWSAHGGSPSSYGSASETEQDRIAANVKYDAWPNC